MCMNIIFNVSSPLLPQFPSTSSCTKSWSQSLLHIVVASYNSSLSHCYRIFHEFFLLISRTEHVLKHYSIAKCMNFPFQRVLICPKLIPNKRVMSILSQRCNLNFRMRSIQSFCHISLYGSSNSLILDALEQKFHEASEYQLFLPCTSLSMCKI